MDTEGISIATITLARNPAEERLIVRSLSALKQYPVITADGGSRPRFVSELHKLEIQIVCPQKKGLVLQVKASLRAALDASDNPLILYTEPDKLPFFHGPIETFIARVKKGAPAALSFASRDSQSFATFPQGQQRVESFMNESTAVILGTKADYCYGPLLLSRAAARLVQEAPEHLGWGWRFWLLGRIARKKLKFKAIDLPAPCPAEQRKENSREDQIYRMKQLRQNLEGLFLGLEML
jgi:hypothetical protein